MTDSTTSPTKRPRDWSPTLWAGFFGQIGWTYTYVNGHTPGFVIHGDRPMFVRVTNAVTEADYQAAADFAIEWPNDILIVGANPSPQWRSANWGDEWPVAGLLGEYRADDEPGWAFEDGLWHSCSKCGHAAVHHSVLSFAGRPCGHYDGDHYLEPLAASTIRALWEASG